MHREISISGHGFPAVSAAPRQFTEEYGIATSLYPSIFPPEHSPLLDNYLNDVASSISPSRGSEGSLCPYWPQIQHRRLHRDLVDRHQVILSHLREVAKQAHALRQENVNLKMANLDLNNRLSFLLDATPFDESVVESPTSVMVSGRVGDERVNLPKSISVRSRGYLKAVRTGGKGGDCVRASHQNKIDNGTQKVYVKGGDNKEQPLELEVYNQGMFKTELCNKWQQTGTCPYGDNCQFAHGIDELRPVIRHPRYKTDVCRMVLNGVPCPYGHRCHFRHTLADDED